MAAEVREQAIKLPDPDYPEPGGVLACGLTVVVAKKFPIPDVAGLTPDEAESVLAKWRAAAHAYYYELIARQRDLALRKGAKPEAASRT